MFFRIGVYEPERVAAAREGEGPQMPANHSPLFAPVPKPTIETGITAMTLAVLGAFDQKARTNERDGAYFFDPGASDLILRRPHCGRLEG